VQHMVAALEALLRSDGRSTSGGFSYHANDFGVRAGLSKMRQGDSSVQV